MKTLKEIIKWHKEHNPNSGYKKAHFENMFLLQYINRYYYKEFDLPITKEALKKEGFVWKELMETDEDENKPIFYNAWVKKAYINYVLHEDKEGFYRVLNYGCMGRDSFRIKNFQELQKDYIRDNWFKCKLNPENFKIVKLFYQQDNIGRAKYTISYHDGVQTHNDGSPFYSIRLFSNKKELNKFRTELFKQGYSEK